MYDLSYQDLTARNISQELSGVTHKAPSKVAEDLAAVGVTCTLRVNGEWKNLGDMHTDMDTKIENVQVKCKGGGIVILGTGHSAFDVADSCRDLADV